MTIEYIASIKPRISDINYGGHLGHVELINLLHEIRVLFLKEHHMSESDIDGCALIMRNLAIDYYSQAFWGNELNIKMKIRLDGARIIFNYVVNNLTLNNKTAEGQATMVLFNKESEKPTKPDIFFEKFNNESNSTIGS